MQPASAFLAVQHAHEGQAQLSMLCVRKYRQVAVWVILAVRLILALTVHCR